MEGSLERSRADTLQKPASSRDKILDVSEALFAQRGFAGVGLREVADAVGLGKSSLFHHFRGKGPLYYEVLERVLERIGVRLDTALQAASGPREQLHAWIDALIDALAEYPTSARLLLRGLFEDEALPRLPEADRAERVLGRILQQIHRLLRAGVDSGAFRPVSVPDTVQTLIGASVYHFASAEIGESVLGGPIFSADAVRRRKRELKRLLDAGLVAR